MKYFFSARGFRASQRLVSLWLRSALGGENYNKRRLYATRSNSDCVGSSDSDWVGSSGSACVGSDYVGSDYVDVDSGGEHAILVGHLGRNPAEIFLLTDL
ncbi:MAG: hypothetical protein Q8N43_02215 [Candidatus Azambacteria bacterium]|nr:hypothetical protein [Candidatus Azambacteria bacterium]